MKILPHTLSRVFHLEQEQRRLMLSVGFVFGILLIATFLILSIFILYTAGESWQPWALPHLYRTLVGLPIMVFILCVPISLWYRNAYLLYGINLFLLMLIPFIGITSMGAQRWFSIGSFFIQPSEPMKLFILLALARYIHDTEARDISKLSNILPAAMLVTLPVIFILHQPDLGTSLLIIFASIIAFFLAGVKWQIFASLGFTTALSAPLIWFFLMHDFQRQRVLSFLNPENDLLGAGYQLMQSKIAVGSGGLFGQGFMQGSQNILGFIPAKHTDFIFAVYAEQFGFIGSSALLLLLVILLLFTVQTAASARSSFGRILALSLGAMWIMQSLINLGMVVGLLPVVGIPLPFLSYGGTSLWTTMAGFAFVLNIYIHQFSGLRAFK